MDLKDKSRISIDMDFVVLVVYNFGPGQFVPVRIPRIYILKKSALSPQKQLSKKRLGNVVEVNTPGSKNDRPPSFNTQGYPSFPIR
jgi:hypothetical protein